MTDWYTENRQNRQLEELRDEMSQAMSEASNLRSRLSQLQGGLESRLGRLASAFDAFVELSDIRYELIGFADAAEVRRNAGQVLSALASGEEPPAPGREVPGYWLGPALEALRGLSADAISQPAEDLPTDPAGDPPSRPLDEAMALDERRTSIFLCLALAALGRRNQVRAQWLDTAFGTLASDGTVTRVQRAVWTAGARGGFGADGLTLIVERLQTQVKGSAQNWLGAVELRADVVPKAGPDFTEIAAQAKAQAQLKRLRAAVETIAGDTAVLEPDRDLGYTAGEPDPDSTSALLRMLISEGSEPERAPLARVAELRAQITDGAETSTASITDPAGAVEELLKADLRQADEPHLAATALRVVAAGLLTDAEELAETANLPSPRQVTCEIDWQQITLLPDGPEPQSLAAAGAKIAASAPPLSLRSQAGTLAIAAAGVLVAAGLGFVHWFWIVVGVGILGLAARRYWRARTAATEAQADATKRIAKLRETSTQAAADLETYQNQSTNRAAGIAANLEEIRKRLTV
jgi:hypothetical protein